MLASFLQEIMNKKNIGVSELAQLAGISKGHISRLMSSQRHSPSLATLMKLSAALNIDYDILLVKAGYISENAKKDIFSLLAVEDVYYRNVRLTTKDRELITRIMEAIFHDRENSH